MSVTEISELSAPLGAELASPRERMGLCWCCCGEADVEPLLEDDDRRWERESAAAAASSIACVPSVGVSDFEVLSVLGRGAYGRVLQVRQRHTQELFAMKVMKKEDVVERNQIRHALTERALLGALRHPFIVPLHYAFDSESHLYLVLALMSGGELFFHLKRDGAFSEARARLYGAEILLALEALHQVRLSRCVSQRAIALTVVCASARARRPATCTATSSPRMCSSTVMGMRA